MNFKAILSLGLLSFVGFNFATAPSIEEDKKAVFSLNYESYLKKDNTLVKRAATSTGFLCGQDFLDAAVYINETLYARLMEYVSFIPEDKAKVFLENNKSLIDRLKSFQGLSLTIK